MRSFLFVLLAGCAVSPVIVEEESRSLIGGPEPIQQEEASPSATEIANAFNGSVEGSLPAEEEEEAVSSSVFVPGKIDVDVPEIRGIASTALPSPATAQSVC